MKTKYTAKTETLKTEYSERAGHQMKELHVKLSEIRYEVRQALKLLEHAPAIA